MKLAKTAAIMTATMLTLSACGGPPGQNSELSEESLSGQYLTGASGGVYDVLGSGISQVISTNTENISINPSTPSSINVIPGQVNDGDAVLGTMQIDQFNRAVDGEGEFEQTHDNLKVMFGLYTNVFGHITTAGTGIEELADVTGKRIAVSSESTKGIVENLYETAGISADDVEWIYLSFSEQEAALKDGDIDVATITSYPRNGTVESLTATEDIQFIDVPDDIEQQWNDENPETPFAIVPGETYAGIEDDASFISLSPTLATNADIPENHVYEITRAVFENHDDVAAVHPAGEQTTLETTQSWVDAGLLTEDMFHPGALDYLTEAGLELS